MDVRALLAGMGTCVVLSGCMHVRVTEKQFFRPDAPGQTVEKRVAGAGVTELSVTGEGGAALQGILFEQPNARSTVLYFGGNMFHIDRHLGELLPVLSACGSNVAVFDYRGYGRSSGQPTVENMHADALAIFDTLNARYPGRVIVHGQSLGSFVAADVAQQRPVAGTVLETTATTVTELVESKLPWYAWPFARVEVEPSLRQADNRKAAARFESPTLVIAAGKDQMTPTRMGKEVFDAIPRSDKRYLLLPQAGHNGALRDGRAGAAYCDFVRSL